MPFGILHLCGKNSCDIQLSAIDAHVAVTTWLADAALNPHAYGCRFYPLWRVHRHPDWRCIPAQPPPAIAAGRNKLAHLEAEGVESRERPFTSSFREVVIVALHEGATDLLRGVALARKGKREVHDRHRKGHDQWDERAHPDFELCVPMK